MHYVADSPDDGLVISPEEHTLASNDVTGLAEAWYDISHDLASYLYADNRIYFMEIQDLSFRRTVTKKLSAATPTLRSFTYDVFLKYFDLQTA